MLWKLRKLRASINRIKAELSIPLFRLESLFNLWIPPRNLQSFAHEMPKASMSKKKKKKMGEKTVFSPNAVFGQNSIDKGHSRRQKQRQDKQHQFSSNSRQMPNKLLSEGEGTT